jgi:hypothetical protein
VELATHDYPADAEGDASFQRWPVIVAGRVEAHMLTGMSRHGRKQREAYLLPFLCQGACARGGRGGMGPF